MSHIDSFRHEIVGLLAGLPVYHPLEIIDGDFSATPAQLVLGGGSGEHPALVFLDLPAAVAHFLDERCTSLQAGPRRDANQRALLEQLHSWRDRYEPYRAEDASAVLAFHDWDDDTHAAFRVRCVSEALPSPWFPEFDALEDWLLLGVGEFVFFSMPELAGDILTGVDAPYANFRHTYHNNILLIPPRMPVYANAGNAFRSERSR